MNHAPDHPALLRPRRWFLIAAVLLAVLLMGYFVFFWENFHVVVPGTVYRSAQPTPQMLRRYRDRHGIRSVINLRGAWNDDDWYQAEKKAAAELGLGLYDVSLRTHRLPPVEELKKLVKVLGECEKPILIHCARGADRTSLASAIYLVLFEGLSPQKARAEYRFLYGHNGWARGHHLPHLFDCYRDWLSLKGKKHSADAFRQWASGIRTLGYFGARIELENSPKEIRVGQPVELFLSVTNVSQHPWNFARSFRRGIHLCVRVHSPSSTEFEEIFFGAEPGTLQPKEKTRFPVTLPPFDQPGECRIAADLIDPHGFFFHEMARDSDFGSLTIELRVLPARAPTIARQPNSKLESRL